MLLNKRTNIVILKACINILSLVLWVLGSSIIVFDEQNQIFCSCVIYVETYFVGRTLHSVLSNEVKYIRRITLLIFGIVSYFIFIMIKGTAVNSVFFCLLFAFMFSITYIAGIFSITIDR